MCNELVKRLRYCSKEQNGCGICALSSDCVLRVGLLTQAAYAIEELSMKLHGDEAAIAGMKREIERMVVAGKPRWIPVTEQCPEKSGDYLVFDDCRNLYVNEWHCLLKKWQYDDSRITHWQPLPEPPKEESDG